MEQQQNNENSLLESLIILKKKFVFDVVLDNFLEKDIALVTYMLVNSSFFYFFIFVFGKKGLNLCKFESIFIDYYKYFSSCCFIFLKQRKRCFI